MKPKINSSSLNSSVKGKEKFQATQETNKRHNTKKKHYCKKRKNSNVTFTTLVAKTNGHMGPGAHQLKFLTNHWFSHWKG